MAGDNLGDDYKGAFHRAADAANEAFTIPGAMVPESQCSATLFPCM
jgi:hypothetical protein